MKIQIIIIFFIIGKILSSTFKIKKYSQAQNYRNLKSTSQIYGNSLNLFYYYVNLLIGKEQNPQTYILDTASSLTTSPCTLCEKCGKNHLNDPFPVSKEEILLCENSRCKLVNDDCYGKYCSFYVSYSEGSVIEGYFIEKIINFDYYNLNISKFNNISIPIGCTTSETELFKTQIADGIMGLDNSIFSFTSILQKNGIIKNNYFSLCLADEGGYFFFFFINNELHYYNISYVDFDKNEERYNILINDIIIGNETILIKKNAFIDSGSTYTLIPEIYGRNIVEQFLNICNNSYCGKYVYDKHYGPCFTFENNEEIIYSIDFIFPNITFTINNEFNYIWTPKNYYFNISEAQNNTICLGFTYHSSNKFVLGTTWMKNYNIIFDKENGKIGFAYSNCSKELNLKEKEENEKEEEGEEDEEEEEKKINNNKKIPKREKNEKDNKQILIDIDKKYFYILTGIIIIGCLIFIFCKLRKRKGNSHSNNENLDSIIIPNHEIEMKSSENSLINKTIITEN